MLGITRKGLCRVYDTVSDLSDDSEPGRAGDVELACLAFGTSILQASVVISGEAEPSDYHEVQVAIEEWLSTIDREDIEAASP